MIKVNALGDTCPIPVVKAKNAIKELNGAGEVEVLVDNEIAVQNLTKMAIQKGYGIQSEKLEEQKYRVLFTIEGAADGQSPAADQTPEAEASDSSCQLDKRGQTVVVISSSKMGEGNDELGQVLMKGFIYALTQQDELPSAILFYNGGASLTCEEAPTLEDLKSLEAQGVEILTCGTCLNYYGLTEKLSVGSVTNMYAIVEKLTQAAKVIRP
jgi:selenium metabolism protein YedF